MGEIYDPDSSPFYINIRVEGPGVNMTMLDPGIFEAVPFLSLESRFTMNSRGNPSIIIIGD